MDPRNRVYTVEQCRELERIAIEDFNIPAFDLMIRAGNFAFDQLIDTFPYAQSVKVIAGSGNNAGDGYIVAGLAKKHGLNVSVWQVGDRERLKGSALKAMQWMVAQGVEPESEVGKNAEILVDALLGTGVRGRVRPEYLDAIEYINQFSQCRVVALDVPSGVDPDTGARLTERPVKADLTCTFVGKNTGLFTGEGVDVAGTVKFSDLQVPKAAFEQVVGVDVLEPSSKTWDLPARNRSDHKHKLGHVLVVGGDLGSGGAVILAAEAALRSGAGLVSAITRPEHVGGFLSRVPEVMVTGSEEHQDIESIVHRADVVALGPGMSESSWSQSMMAAVLKVAENQRLVLDAGALRLLDGSPLPPGAIVTPHPGEAAHLLSCSSRDVQSDRVAAVRELTRKLGCVGVLKGAGSLIADRGSLVCVTDYSDPVLATAGSGDVLTGIIAAAYGLLGSPVEAARCGVALHCRSGTAAKQHFRGQSVIAGDLISYIHPWS